MWTYNGKVVESISDAPEDAVGFVYLIVNEDTGKKYIGKKYLYSERKKLLTKREKELPENKRKKYKYVRTESNWMSYNSSCEELLEDIAAGATITKHIMEWTCSKIQTTYLEVKLQFLNHVLESDDWYNKNINSSWFRGNIGKECTEQK